MSCISLHKKALRTTNKRMAIIAQNQWLPQRALPWPEAPSRWLLESGHSHEESRWDPWFDWTNLHVCVLLDPPPFHTSQDTFGRLPMWRRAANSPPSGKWSGLSEPLTIVPLQPTILPSGLGFMSISWDSRGHHKRYQPEQINLCSSLP